MAIERTAALVVGSFPLGESDRVVTFFTRRFGKVRGVARAARRLRSRFGGALELFTLGELVFFDGGRSELVQVDHFDIVRPFERVRNDLHRLGQGAWMAECVTRLTADRDASPPLWTLLVTGLDLVDTGASPDRVAVIFGARCIDVLGHRLRTDGCVACGRGRLAAAETVALDVEAGGTCCPSCAAAMGRAITVRAATVAALRRLRTLGWDDALAARLGPAERELRQLLEAQVAFLIGQSTRSSRFIREVARVPVTPEPGP
jgi:DNA repair protein RecO (recombination protein O)